MDVKNAFNTMSREAFLSALAAHPTLQALLPLACQFYIEPSRLLVRGAGNSFVELAFESGQRNGIISVCDEPSAHPRGGGGALP